MKTFLTQLGSLFIFLLAIVHSGFAQVNWNSQCGTVQAASLSLMQPDTVVNGDSIIIIPTVFHILNLGGAENISKSHVQRALQILNQDFNRQNPDTFDIPAAFHPVRGNPKVEFRLARIDPQGNCTDGINRVYTSAAIGPGNIDSLYLYTWDHTLYMNIYVVKWIDDGTSFLEMGLTYVASIDSGQTDPDYFDLQIVAYNGLADGFNEVPPGYRGHVLTHEMGHNLGLLHPFGLPGCGDDDFVADTPLQDDYSFGCPSFPQISCGNGPDGDMFNNFMDGAQCMNMFTAGQADRMRTCLANNEWRAALWTPANLVASGVDTLQPVCQNPPVADFGYGNFGDWLCAGKPVPFYEASSWEPTSFQWEFTGGIPATSTDTFPSVIFPDSGMYNVKLIVSNSFGIDTVEKVIRIEPAEVNYSIPMTESFEDTVFNQQIAPWTLLGKRWSVTNLASYSGNNSIRLDSSLNYISSFFTHSYDLNQIIGTGRTLEFKVALGLSAAGAPMQSGLRVTWKRPCAYERYELEASSVYGAECGVLNVGNGISSDSLKTVTTNAVFIPIDSTQWKTITLPIPDSLTGEIQIGFIWYNFAPTYKFKGLYVDDIKVLIPVGIAENNTAVNWNLYPNPATNQLIIVLPENNKNTDVTITDITGKIIYKTIATSTQKIEVNTSDFAEGIYLVQIQSEKFIETKKVVVSK